MESIESYLFCLLQLLFQLLLQLFVCRLALFVCKAAGLVMVHATHNLHNVRL